MLVAARHQLKEQHRAGAGDRQITDFVDHEDGGMREHFETRLQSAGARVTLSSNLCRSPRHRAGWMQARVNTDNMTHVGAHAPFFDCITGTSP